MNEIEVAVLGPAGTFTEAAATKMLPQAKLKYLESEGEVFEYAQSGGVGVVAVENNLEGSVGATLEGLMKYDVKIIGETVIDISLALIASEGVGKEDIKTVLSHPHALGQCRKYLKKKLNASIQPVASTSHAMDEVLKNPKCAAVGTKWAAKNRGLNVLDIDIQDLDSQTRFITIGSKSKGGPKTSILFAAKDDPGTLYKILKVFAENNLNLTKIESRPKRKKLGEYIFYLDYENSGLATNEIHQKISGLTTYLKDLGSY